MKTMCFNFLLDLIAMRLRFCLVWDLNILIQVIVSASCGINTDSLDFPDKKCAPRYNSRIRYVTATHFFFVLKTVHQTKVVCKNTRFDVSP